MRKSLYVHVPFCEQICHYCDFNKFFLKNQPVDEYVEAAVEEMKKTAAAFPQHEFIETIYIGGGTPTSLSSTQLKHLLEAIPNNFTLADTTEWTVEVNPGSADKEKFEMIKQAGVNRLSIGAQTFDPDLLQKINRDHKPAQVEETIRLAQDAGIDNLSIDLMFGLPGQTMEQWKDTLSQAAALPIKHISAYSLKIEPKTVFYQMLNKGTLKLPEQELEAEMYEYMLQFLREEGFQAYEISNFARNREESLHNLTYWDNNEYYGIGAGAHSYMDGVRRRNHGPLPKYLKAIAEDKLPYLEENPVSRKEMMEEEMFMGLRKRLGVSKKKFENRYDQTIDQAFPGIITGLKQQGLLEETDYYIYLTETGLLLGNEVFEQFLAG
ncbi:radical SAM family heme chaperone HemW [Alkalicoccus daliensis]|uniref:Heme chaperone HemW n=1 Tax=Alkalicoccus daliensis TaxID=745820 RepID=A0A1H0BE66_9BACI|nr:radical SAM family heme chaperone HemW [Alkalicoccus daliensis]SDN43954.1 oxygen-independent coproporphyrinogen-3 oxidase [Alkalicoccus daliensis]